MKNRLPQKQSLKIQENKMNILKSAKGTIFITVVIMVGLIGLISAAFSNMILQDMNMIKHLRYSGNAQLLAEGGISDAMGTLVRLGFTARTNAANFPQRNLGGGTYDVTVTSSGSRVLLTSVGTYRGVSRTVSCEIRDLTPTALYYMMSAGGELRFRAFALSLVDINGDLHANSDVRLSAKALALVTVDPCADPSGCCDGDVSASNRIYITEGLLGYVQVAGSQTEGADLVIFPNYDFAYYKALAQASGDYYSGDADIGTIGTTTTLTPANEMIYVEDTAYIYGTVNITGGLVADRIRVIGRLVQHKGTTNRNVILTRTNDMEIFYRLNVEEAVVYAARDFSVLSAGSYVEVTGALLAGRNIKAWDFLTYIIYNHRLIYSDGLVLGSGGFVIELVNWTR